MVVPGFSHRLHEARSSVQRDAVLPAGKRSRRNAAARGGSDAIPAVAGGAAAAATVMAPEAHEPGLDGRHGPSPADAALAPPEPGETPPARPESGASRCTGHLAMTARRYAASSKPYRGACPRLGPARRAKRSPDPRGRPRKPIPLHRSRIARRRPDPSSSRPGAARRAFAGPARQAAQAGPAHPRGWCAACSFCRCSRATSV